MNFHLILLLLTCCLILNTSADLIPFKNLFSNFFKSSTSNSNSESKTSQSIFKTKDDTFKEHTATVMERSSLISEQDAKLPIGGHMFKDGLFRNNFIVQLQDMLSKKSIDSSKRSAIVNIDDDDDYGFDGLIKVDTNTDLENNKNSMDLNNLNHLTPPLRLESPLKVQSSQNSHIVLHGTHTEYASNDDDDDDDDDDEYDEEEDDFNSGIHKKSVADMNTPSNKTTFNSTGYRYVHNRTHPLNATYKFDNQTNTTSYTYLDKQADTSDLVPIFLNSNLLGNTLESIENIMQKYNFLNLYPSPTINETHNDRDLHQKNDDRVVLKANFADYSGYTNTEKSIIHGPSPPVQDLTDISYGNARVHNDPDKLKNVKSNDAKVNELPKNESSNVTIS